MVRQPPFANRTEASHTKPRSAETETAQRMERVRAAQAALTRLGYPVGAASEPHQGVTGEWTEQTRLAVLEFQEEFGLLVTGELDEETYAIIVGAGSDRGDPKTPAHRQDLPIPVGPEGEPMH